MRHYKEKKTIMKRSNLQKIYLKKDTWIIKKVQGTDYCSRLHKKEPKKFFTSLDSSKICDNKTFWKTIQSFFSGKREITSRINLVDENETVISDDQLMSEEFNQLFKNTTKALNIRENSYLIDKTLVWYWKRFKKSNSIHKKQVHLEIYYQTFWE